MQREWQQRRAACELVCGLCSHLFAVSRRAERVRDVQCTAMLYLQRFYIVHPCQDHSYQLVACAAVLVAAKAEEVAVKPKVITAALLALHPTVFHSALTATAPELVSEITVLPAPRFALLPLVEGVRLE